MASGKIYSVDEVMVKIARTRPSLIIVHGLGRTSTTGWSDGALSRYVYLTPPADGVQEFDFIARMPDPGTSVLDVLTPISAHFEIPDVDVENYWGKNMPLKGIRLHAVANSKIVNVVSRKEAVQLSMKMSPRATARYVGETTGDEVPGFEEDIKPLFRQQDVSSMLVFGPFNLHSYDDVKAHADEILKRLRDDMPCDGRWPETDIAKFEAWKNGGMPA
jgi:hypothetical protein